MKYFSDGFASLIQIIIGCKDDFLLKMLINAEIKVFDAAVEPHRPCGGRNCNLVEVIDNRPILSLT